MELEVGDFGRHRYSRRKCEICRFAMEQSNERWPAGCWGGLVTARDVEPFRNIVLSTIGI